mgnify:CR=1 FL=1
MLPLWLCIPFAGLLLCIAIMPLVKAEWWESHQIHAVIFWSLLFIIPYAVTKGASTAAETVLECIINDYLSFIILLFGLFCVTGNISVDGDLVGSPRVNTITLLIGTFLSSLIGTTGASMLLVRPLYTYPNNMKTIQGFEDFSYSLYSLSLIWVAVLHQLVIHHFLWDL